jgi:hypothetical protein
MRERQYGRNEAAASLHARFQVVKSNASALSFMLARRTQTATYAR